MSRLTTLKPRVQTHQPRMAALPAPSMAEGYRIRGRRLQSIRERHFAEHPLCVHCEAKGITAIATELDHRIPLSKGGQDVESNRQGLCADCHLAKTIIDLRP